MLPGLRADGHTCFQLSGGDAPSLTWPHVPLRPDLCAVSLFQLLTNHYEQNWKYYCLPSGWGTYGTASEDELLLTKKLFWGIFDSLSQRVSTRASPFLISHLLTR